MRALLVRLEIVCVKRSCAAWQIRVDEDGTRYRFLECVHPHAVVTEGHCMSDCRSTHSIVAVKHVALGPPGDEVLVELLQILWERVEPGAHEDRCGVPRRYGTLLVKVGGARRLPHLRLALGQRKVVRGEGRAPWSKPEEDGPEATRLKPAVTAEPGAKGGGADAALSTSS